MTNLFSSFDPCTQILFFNFNMNWVSSMLICLLFPQVYWIRMSQFSKSIEKIISFLSLELEAIFSKFCMKGNIFLFINIFFFIFFSNVLGLFPYIFTSSSHLIFTLTLSLPMWIGGMVWSVIFQFNHLMAHLVPLGTPAPLLPVMVIIETVSSIIRPGTLAIRLAANMVAGHLLLSLLGSQNSGSSAMMFLMVLVSLILLLMLELAVACIQSYVFTILSSLYLNEVSEVSFNKEMVVK